MAFSINRVTLLGRCAQDPELRYTPEGTPVCNVSIATSYSYQQDGQWKEVPQFTRCVFWRNAAENVAEHTKKGEYLYVDGRIQTRKWENREGQTQYTTEVVVDNYVIPQNKGSRSGSGPDSKSEADFDEGGEGEDFSDIPF